MSILLLLVGLVGLAICITISKKLQWEVIRLFLTFCSHLRRFTNFCATFISDSQRNTVLLNINTDKSWKIQITSSQCTNPDWSLCVKSVFPCNPTWRHTSQTRYQHSFTISKFQLFSIYCLHNLYSDTSWCVYHRLLHDTSLLCTSQYIMPTIPVILEERQFS